MVPERTKKKKGRRRIRTFYSIYRLPKGAKGEKNNNNFVKTRLSSYLGTDKFEEKKGFVLARKGGRGKNKKLKKKGRRRGRERKRKNKEKIKKNKKQKYRIV